MVSMWTDEKEEEFVAMIEGKPELFDITERNYSNKAAKTNAWQEIGDRLGVSEKELRKKWDSLRTQYCRYQRHCTLAGPRTARQDWVLQRLKFLDPHLRKKNPQGCTEQDYQITVVENSYDDEGSPTPAHAQVDVELESDGLAASTPQPQPRSQKRARPDAAPEVDAASLRRMLFSTLEEVRREDHWDIFGRYVVSCLRGVRSDSGRFRLQDELCGVLHRTIQGEREDDEASEAASDEGERTAASTPPPASKKAKANANAGSSQGSAPLKQLDWKRPAEEDDLEPFLRSMFISMRRLPDGAKAELKFRIHELVHKSQMKCLYGQPSSQNATGGQQVTAWENGVNYNLI